MTLRFLFLFLSTVMAAPAAAQGNEGLYVYVALAPATCSIGYNESGGEELHVYVASGQYSNLGGVVFRLETDRFGPEHIQSLTPAPGVTIAGGDLFSGIVLSFSPRALNHEPVLTFQVSRYPLYGDVETRDVYMNLGGAYEPVPPVVTNGGIVDCLGEFADWYPPDGWIDVRVDQDDSFTFRAMVGTSYPTLSVVNVDDPDGWVPSSFEQEVFDGCTFCDWLYTRVTVPVHVPPDVPDHTLNTVTLRIYANAQLLDEHTVTLRAVNPVAVAPTTWGRIKALYR